MYQNATGKEEVAFVMDSIDIMMRVQLDDDDAPAASSQAASPGVPDAAQSANLSPAAATREAGSRPETSGNDATTSSSSYSTSHASVADPEDADDEEDANADEDDDDDIGDDEVQEDEDDVNEEDRNDEYSGNFEPHCDDPSNAGDSSEHEDDDGQLVIAAHSESGVIVVPRGASMSNVTSTTQTSTGQRSSYVVVNPSSGQLVELSAATLTNVGSDSTMLTASGAARCSPAAQRRYTASSAAVAAPCPVVSDTPGSSASTAAVKASDGPSTSATSGSTVRSSTHHPSNKPTQAQSQRNRQAPVITGYATIPVVAMAHGPMTLRDSFNSQHLQLLPMPFEPGTSVSRASTQLVDLLRRRADTLTQKCLRIQKESLNKATELFELSTRLKTLKLEQSVEEKRQLALFNEYRRVRGIARTSLSILRKINMAESLIAATRHQLVKEDVTDPPTTSLPGRQQPSIIPLSDDDTAAHSMQTRSAN